MVQIRGETVIARPVGEVFDFVADERNEPKYNPHMMRVEKTTPGPVGIGTRWAATIESRGRPVAMAMEITEYRRPSRLGTRTSMSTGEINGTVTFEPCPLGTRLRWSWELRLKGVVNLLTPVIGWLGQRQEATTWAMLKHHLEDA
jgi:uncharacterized protein YndB with AHSA1/START domain